uniref:SWIM-type domain-containing protein n=1 Tax=Glycine max TaxID=3847 RepID=A0A0R0KFN2_SOYBN
MESIVTVRDIERDLDDIMSELESLSKEECISIDSMVDITQFDMKEISGFSVRRSHIVRNTCMETLQQTFFCSCAEKKESRCGCEAMFRVHVHFLMGRWYVTCWNFDHNHLLLDLKLSCLLPGHRKMSTSDIMQVENYRKVGIRPPYMYAAFANQCGGYDKVGFIRKDIYNEEGRMRKQHSSDARGALKYLYDLRKKDPMMYVSYTADGDQLLYEVFDDVLAFDATYKKNKYLCPFVVFSSVNHHNQTIVFVAAIVTDETEETYVWLLEQLSVAMKGKAPCSIITDGDLAMRNAITKVMPGIEPCSRQTLVEFEEKWKEMVATFEFEDNTWIGCVFVGIQTTSRCEAFHAHVAKYVHSRTNLTDFIEQFQRCLAYFLYRVIVADYSSTYGNEVLQTNLRSLERSGDDLFAKEMFKLFQSYLCRTIKLRLVDCKEMVRFSVYTVVKYCSGSVWHVSYCPSTVDFTCTCMRMQSIGLPCDHILAVLVSLNFMELPSSLVLNRWSKLATEQMKDKYPDSAMYWDSQLMARYATLVEVSRQVCVAAYRDEEEYDKMLHFLSNEARRLKSKQNTEHCVDDNQSQQQDGDDFEVKDVDRSEWMNVADKGKSKSVANVVELATTSVLAPTVLGMEMVVFHPSNKLTVCCKLHMKITLKW